MARAPLPPPPFCAPRNGQLGTGGGQACHYTHSQTTITLFDFYLGRKLAIFAFIETFILFSISTGVQGTLSIFSHNKWMIRRMAPASEQFLRSKQSSIKNAHRAPSPQKQSSPPADF